MPKIEDDFSKNTKEHGPNYYEYAIEKKVSKKIGFIRSIYKFFTVICVFALDLVFGFWLSEKLGSAYIPFIFISPFVMLAAVLAIIYFVNGFFYTSFEYEVEKGVFRITRFNGKHVFGHIYKKDLINMPISEIERIAESPSSPGISYDACSGNADRQVAYALYMLDGKKVETAFENTEKLKRLLKFYNSKNAFAE